jgi:acyl-CoA synthetase (AMP-forming)/AMP-acid ligase II
MTLVDALDTRSRVEPHRTLFTVIGEGPGEAGVLTQLELSERSAVIARHLARRGIRRGDRVAFALETRPELILGIVATQRLGATPAVLNPGLPSAALARQIELISASLVIAEHDLAALEADRKGGDEAPFSEAALSDFAYLQLTSGTSGESKAAAITHANLLASLEASRELGVRPDDQYVSWVPLHHDLGLVRFVMQPLYFGVSCFLLQPSIKSLGPWLRTIAEKRATLTGAPDFAYRLAARTVPALDLSSLRMATNGGEPVRASTIAAFESKFACPGAIRPGYGLAEATLTVSTARPGSPLRVDPQGNVGCGPPVLGMELRVVRDGSPAAVGEVGELEIRGKSVFAGYWTENGIDRHTFDDGWHRTGDTGYLGADGEVFVLGRTRAMIKRAGALIAPREVEEAADRAGAAHGLRFSAAVGASLDPHGTEALVVVCETRPDAPPSEPAVQAVARAVRDAVGIAPSRVHLVPPGSIPMTANGKIRYAELRRRIEAAAPPFSVPPPAA